MRELEQVLQHHQRIGAALIERGHAAERVRRIALEHRLQEVEDQAAISDAEHALHRRSGHRAAAQRNRLVEQRQTVAHRAVGGAGDELRSPPARRQSLSSAAIRA